MSFKTYDYRCLGCGTVEERFVRGSASDDQYCECEGKMQRLLCSPKLDIAGMARAGCPGAVQSTGDAIEKRHRSVDQMHRKAQ